ARGADEWIVCGNKIICAPGGNGWMRSGREIFRTLINVEAQDAGKKVFIDALTIVTAVASVAFGAKRKVEVAVGTAMEIAGVVVFEIVELIDQNDFAGWIGGVWIRGGNFEARETIVTRGRRDVEDVKIAVLFVVRMEGETEKALFAVEIHARADVEEREDRRC